MPHRDDPLTDQSAPGHHPALDDPAPGTEPPDGDSSDGAPVDVGASMGFEPGGLESAGSEPSASQGTGQLARGPGAVDRNTGQIRAGRLAGLTMWQAIFVLSWPVLIESLLNAMVGLVDTTLAASLSEAATDAIGVASYFQWFIGLIGMSLGIGATAMVSRAMGRGRIAAANAALGQVMLLSVALGIVGAGLIALGAPLIASMMGLNEESGPLAITYLRTVAWTVPFVTMMFSGIACIRGAGDSVRPMVTMIAVNAVNIFVSFALAGVDLTHARTLPDGTIQTTTIVHNPFPFELGILGIALGTLVAWTVGAAIVLGLLVRGMHGLRLVGRRLRPHAITSARLVRVAVPNFLETFGMWFGNFLTILMIGWLGVQGYLGAHVVAIRIEAFSFLPGFAMAMAAATLTGQYLGARSPELARLAIIRCATVGAAIMGGFGLLFVFAPEPIVGVFSQQPTHLELTPTLLRICGLVQINFAIGIVIRGAMRGAGDTKVVMAITWFTTYALRLPLAWLFCGVDIPWFDGGTLLHNPAPLQNWFGVHPLVGFWLGLCTELGLRFVWFLIRFLHGGWMRVRV
ncbi:MAG: MATE family efflux transporter [Phycisphaerales bacterium]